MKRILIIEDDVSVRDELKEMLTNSGYDACILSHFEDSKNEILAIRPDLILMDINIPYINGEILLKELRRESDVPVIMVTSRSSETDEVLSMSYGADDYVTKPYNPTILLLRIAAIFRRFERQGDTISYNDLVINPGKGTITGESEEILLTKNEMIIFMNLYNNRNRIVSRDELMTDLWNNDEYINDNALTVNISRLRGKLKDIGYGDMIETRKGQGYILL